MLENKKYIILLSLASVLIASLLAETYSMIFALVLIFSFGLLHGSNDIQIIQKMTNFRKRDKIKYIMLYLLMVIIGLVLFLVFPRLALPFFILISAYHFGEQHFQIEINSKKEYPILKIGLFFSYGIYLFSLLFFSQYESSNEIVSDFGSFWPEKSTIGYILIISTFIAFTTVIISSKVKLLKNQAFFDELIYLIIYVLVFNSVDLIVGFAIYFTFWHSLPSLKDQQKYLYADNSITSFVNYFKKAWIYWVISLVGLFAFIFFLYDYKHMYSLFFAFVAAITFPHVVIMRKMFSDYGEKE